MDFELGLSTIVSFVAAPGSRAWWPWILAYLVIVLAIYLAWGRAGARPSIAGGFHFLFPKSVYWNRSALHDIFVALAAVLGFAAISVVLGFDLSSLRQLISFVDSAFTSLFSIDRQALKGGFALDIIFTVCLFLAYELAMWLVHFLFHKVPVLWAFHKVHHNATALNPLTAQRIHLAELVVTFPFVSLVLAAAVLGFKLAGFAPNPIAVFGNISVVALPLIPFANLRHSHVRLRFGKALESVFMSPLQHQLHHSCRPEHIDKNFGVHTNIFDRLFSTFYSPHVEEAMDFGLRGESAPRSFLQMYFIGPISDCGYFLSTGQVFRFKPAPLSVDEVGDMRG